MKDDSIGADLIARGICACPGEVTGRIMVWEHNNSPVDIEEHDIVVIDTFAPSMLPSLSRIRGIISRNYTAYSHLASLTAMLDIPCIVGAKFISGLILGTSVCLNSTSGIVTKNKLVNSSVVWPYQVANHILRMARENGCWLHTIQLDKLDSQIMPYIKGLFLDASVFHMYSDESTNPLDRIVTDVITVLDHNPQLSLGYRLSANPLKLQDVRRELENEMQFLHRLVQLSIPLKVFIPLVQTKDDVEFFRNLIASEFHAISSIQIGAMIETPQAVDSLESIAQRGLMDFAVVGINDLLSMYLDLDRDDPSNQDAFSLENSFILNALSRIIQVCKKYQIPCLISHPRYPAFPFEYGCLIGLGYTDFFTDQSIILSALRIVENGSGKE